MKTIITNQAMSVTLPAALVAVLEKAIRLDEIKAVVKTGLVNQASNVQEAITMKKAAEGNPFAKLALTIKLGAEEASEVVAAATTRLVATKLRKTAGKPKKRCKKAAKFVRSTTVIFTKPNQADVGKPKTNRPWAVYNLTKAITKVAKTFGCSYKEVFNLDAFDVCRGGDRKEAVCVQQLFAAAKAVNA